MRAAHRACKLVEAPRAGQQALGRVLLDAGIRHVLRIGVGRSHESIRPFFEWFGKQRCACIKAAAMDMTRRSISKWPSGRRAAGTATTLEFSKIEPNRFGPVPVFDLRHQSAIPRLIFHCKQR
jgi:hypothetical protein